MSRVLHIALKDLRLLSRDRFALFWVFGFPVMFALFFGYVLSGQSAKPAGIALAVVDEDGSDFSRRFCERLASQQGLQTQPLARASQAAQRTRKGQVSASIILKPGFGSGLGALFDSAAPKLEVIGDPSRRAETAYLRGIVIQALFEALRERVSDRAWLRAQIGKTRGAVTSDASLSSSQRMVFGAFFLALDQFLANLDDDVLRAGVSGSAFMPFAERSVSARPGAEQAEPSSKHPGRAAARLGPKSYFAISFPQAALWGLIGCAASFAISLVQERARGTLQRLRAAPLSRLEVLSGKGLACFLACLCVSALLFSLGAALFGLRVPSPPLLALAAVCASSCFVGMMVFVCTLGRTEQSVAGAGWGLFLVMSMLGGAMVPLFVMPDWMRTLSNLSPVKWSILAFEGATWRQFSLAELMLPCAIQLAVGAAFFALGLAMLKRQNA